MGEGEGGESSWGRSKSCRAHEKSFIQLSFRKTYVVFAYISNPFFPSSAPTLSDRWWSCSTGEPTSSFNRPRVLIRSLAFFLPVSFFLPPSSPPRCTRNHAFNLDWKKKEGSNRLSWKFRSLSTRRNNFFFNPSFPLSRSSSDYHLFPTGFQEARHSSGNY